ncbi:DUF6090 family protein [Polaribacter sp.]|uniref:DUF6090 family protein n=1 Tax=Polaribacter sp. TaxID=1920175 RepID=UPI004047A698
MIKFFRKIRQKLLSENKFSKYLVYAVGEILLVVIGILIALQINNWNENRKIEKLELSLLKEMQENLRADIQDINTNIGYHERGIQSANIILQSFEKNLPYNDSLNKHYGKVPMIPRFLITENAYNSMNNAGMRIIQNDSLRNAITYHYESAFSFLMDWNEAEWNTQMQDHRELYRKHFKTFNFWGDLVPSDYDKLSKDQEYINYLNNRIGWLTPVIGMYKKNGIKRAEKLIELIDKELENREN